jgi:hypothetical protein
VLGRQPVVDAENRVATAVREDATEVVVRVEVAQHPSAAVEEDEHTESVTVVGSIQARRHATCIDIAALVNRFCRRSLTACADLASLDGSAPFERWLIE